MFFGLSMSFTAWLYTFVFAILAVFAPIFVIENLTKGMGEPLRTIIYVLSIYVLIPMFVSYLYLRKYKATGKGSIIFKVYFGFYFLIFLIAIAKLFSKDGFTIDNILGFLVLGGSVFYMFNTINKTKHITNNMMEEDRENQINMQAEAIYRAKQMEEEAKKRT